MISFQSRKLRKLQRHFPARAISISFRFVDSIFIEASHKAMTISSCGSVVIWSDVLVAADEEDSKPSFRKEFIKNVKVGENALRVIKSVDGFVMISDAAGQIRFYDKELLIVFWCPSHDSIDSVISIGFDLKRQTIDDHAASDKSFPTFPIRDFLVRKFPQS